MEYSFSFILWWKKSLFLPAYLSPAPFSLSFSFFKLHLPYNSRYFSLSFLLYWANHGMNRDAQYLLQQNQLHWYIESKMDVNYTEPLLAPIPHRDRLKYPQADLNQFVTVDVYSSTSFTDSSSSRSPSSDSAKRDRSSSCVWRMGCFPDRSINESIKNPKETTC